MHTDTRYRVAWRNHTTGEKGASVPVSRTTAEDWVRAAGRTMQHCPHWVELVEGISVQQEKEGPAARGAAGDVTCHQPRGCAGQGERPPA
jgi:hypothetical protein